MPVVETWNANSAVDLVTLANASGMSVKLTNAGAAIVTVEVSDRDGKRDNVCLRYPEAKDYLANASSFGSIVGRFANRIGRGKFTLDGREFQLAINNGPNHIHGGPTGFTHRVWKTLATGELPQGSGSFVDFQYVSQDGEDFGERR